MTLQLLHSENFTFFFISVGGANSNEAAMSVDFFLYSIVLPRLYAYVLQAPTLYTENSRGELRILEHVSLKKKKRFLIGLI
jgi:hypothetical protein